MAAPFSNANEPFGSARLAGPEDAARAGLFTREPHSLLVGFIGNQPLWYSGMGGAVCIAGARSGKLRDLLAYNICCGIHTPSMVILDVKGELAAISRWQVPDGKFCIYWNPTGLHGIRGSRINPVGHIRKDSPTLVPDLKIYIENTIAPSGAAQGRFFEGRARELVEGICLTIVEINGVLTLPDLYYAINLVVAGGEAWLDFAFEMSECGYDIAVRTEAEIASAREDSSGGFKGILGEITRAYSCLSDPVLLASVSPPFDFCLSKLCESDQTYQLYLMPPSDFVEAWAPVIKAMLVAARTYKARAPSAPRQTWVLDECGNLAGPQSGEFPLLLRLFTRDAGLGIRPWAFFQSVKQMKMLGADGDTVILSSAALQNWFGVRDLETATMLSRMLGHETLRYRDEQRREAARHARIMAAQSLFGGGDPFRAGLEMAHQARMATVPLLKGRPLRTPDEILNTPPGKQYIFADGLNGPIYADRRAYYEQPFMAGRFHPNPYHPPQSHVQVMTPRGPQWRLVVVEPVPKRFSHYPQYRDGTWSRIA